VIAGTAAIDRVAFLPESFTRSRGGAGPRDDVCRAFPVRQKSGLC